MESIIEVLHFYKDKFPHHITGHPNTGWLYNGKLLPLTSHSTQFIEDEYGMRIFYYTVTSDCGLNGIAIISQQEL